MSGEPSGAPACGDYHCITCSDEGTPLRVVALEGDGLARCEGDATVDVQLVGDVAPGDVVLVHAGVALVRLAGTAAA
jgi:hydrogenase maturation factor